MFRKFAVMTTDGLKEYSFEANGTTKIWYKKIFHKELNVELAKAENPEEQDYSSEAFDELPFIMNMQAEGRDMKTIGEDDYMEWLGKLEGGATTAISHAILGLYLGNTATTSEVKNPEGPQPEK